MEMAYLESTSHLPGHTKIKLSKNMDKMVCRLYHLVIPSVLIYWHRGLTVMHRQALQNETSNHIVVLSFERNIQEHDPGKHQNLFHTFTIVFVFFSFIYTRH